MQLIRSFFLVLFFLPSFVDSQPQLMTGFPILDSSDSPPFHSGSSPVVADFNNDGNNEILFCVNVTTFTGKVFLTDKEGRNLPAWPKIIGGITNYFSSAAGDVNDDGYIDIVVRVKDSVFVWNYNGSNLPGFPVYFGGGLQFEDLIDEVAIYDLDNDGKLEIIINRGGNIAVFNFNGILRSGWPRDISIGQRSFFSLFSVGDLNNDGTAEIIIPVTHYNPSIMKMDSNMIFVLKENGDDFPNFPVESDSGYYFAPSPATIFKNNNDSVYFIINSNYSSDFQLFNYKVRTTSYNLIGNIIQRFFTKTTAECFGIQLGRISGNLLNFVFNSIDSAYVFDNSGIKLSNWPVYAPGGNVYRASAIVKASSNINIISGADRQDTVGGFQNRRGYLWFFNPDGSQLIWSPLRTQGIHTTIPTFCDLDKDHQLDMVYVSAYSSAPVHGTIVYAFTFPGVPYNPADLPWPMYAHDRYRTNQYGFVPPDEPVSVNNNNSEIPSSFILHQNYPNPFNPNTIINYFIPSNVKGQRLNVTLIVYDLLGKEIITLVDGKKSSGSYSVEFNGENLPSGIYFYTLEVNGIFVDAKRMVLLK